jgi:hypothetical protein
VQRHQTLLRRELADHPPVLSARRCCGRVWLWAAYEAMPSTQPLQHVLHPHTLTPSAGTTRQSCCARTPRTAPQVSRLVACQQQGRSTRGGSGTAHRKPASTALSSMPAFCRWQCMTFSPLLPRTHSQVLTGCLASAGECAVCPCSCAGSTHTRTISSAASAADLQLSYTTSRAFAVYAYAGMKVSSSLPRQQ